MLPTAYPSPSIGCPTSSGSHPRHPGQDLDLLALELLLGPRPSASRRALASRGRCGHARSPVRSRLRRLRWSSPPPRRLPRWLHHCPSMLQAPARSSTTGRRSTCGTPSRAASVRARRPRSPGPDGVRRRRAARIVAAPPTGPPCGRPSAARSRTRASRRTRSRTRPVAQHGPRKGVREGPQRPIPVLGHVGQLHEPQRRRHRRSLRSPEAARMGEEVRPRSPIAGATSRVGRWGVEPVCRPPLGPQAKQQLRLRRRSPCHRAPGSRSRTRSAERGRPGTSPARRRTVVVRYPAELLRRERMMGCLSSSRMGPDFGPGLRCRA